MVWKLEGKTQRWCGSNLEKRKGSNGSKVSVYIWWYVVSFGTRQNLMQSREGDKMVRERERAGVEIENILESLWSCLFCLSTLFGYVDFQLGVYDVYSSFSCNSVTVK